MNYEDINYNEVMISGVINNITDTNNKYIKFVSLNIERNLYEIFKDFFVKGNKVFVKGYLNSYKDYKNNIQSFISVTDISDNPEDIMNGRKAPHIRYDPDGVMVWNGKRCERIQPTDEELQEMEELLKEYK